jgi:hypothetical protein
MDWAGWALFGLVATAALTAVMIMAQLAGLTRLDLPLLLGTIVTEDPDRAPGHGLRATFDSSQPTAHSQPYSCGGRRPSATASGDSHTSST